MRERNQKIKGKVDILSEKSEEYLLSLESRQLLLQLGFGQNFKFDFSSENVNQKILSDFLNYSFSKSGPRGSNNFRNFIWMKFLTDLEIDWNLYNHKLVSVFVRTGLFRWILNPLTEEGKSLGLRYAI